MGLVEGSTRIMFILKKLRHTMFVIDTLAISQKRLLLILFRCHQCITTDGRHFD